MIPKRERGSFTEASSALRAVSDRGYLSRGHARRPTILGILFALYGVVAYVAFLVAFTYAIGFLSNIVVPKGIDAGAVGATASAIVINLSLLGLFAVQHTIMARPGFKTHWTKIIPKPIERSTFVLVASTILLLLYWQWRPMPVIVWRVDQPFARMLLYALSALGWCTVLYTSFLIDHFELFGLRQVYFHLRGKSDAQHRFVTPTLYRVVRNPLMLGFVIAFWATPDMTQGHLLFAAAATGYILMGIQFEEHDIARILGEPYRLYKKQTPMLVPRLWPRRAADRSASQTV